MPRESLDLVPDDAGVGAVRALWQKLREAGLPSQADHRGGSNEVHLTLAESTSMADPERAAGAVAAVLPLTLPVAGVVALGSRRSAVALLLGAPPAVAAAVAELRADVGQVEPPWLPHVTLARRVPHDQVGQVVDLVQDHGLTDLHFVLLSHWRPSTGEVTTLAPIPRADRRA